MASHTGSWVSPPHWSCRRAAAAAAAPAAFLIHAPSTHPTTPQPIIAEFLHVKPGKGAAFVRSKLKNLLTGNSNERTFRAGEQLNVADVVRRDGQFTYAEGDSVSLMRWCSVWCNGAAAGAMVQRLVQWFSGRCSGVA
jgi:hypothetical protein